jgi:hypothetical protein
MTVLADDTRLTRTSAGVYERVLDRTWWGHESLFGGYGLALAASAIEAEAAEGSRTIRALTMHFLRPLLDGPFRAEVTVERTGRTVSTVTARLSCRERLCGLAIATLSTDRPSPAFTDAVMPAAEPVGVGEAPLEPRSPVPSHDHFAFFPRFSSGRWRGDPGPMVTGGWIRTWSPEALSVGLLCAYGDIWVPAVYRRLETPVATMSSDFTAHIRVPLPSPTGEAVDASTNPVLCRLRTAAAGDGFVDEDTELWSVDGRLLAHTRQLRVMQAIAVNGPQSPQ